MAEEINGPIGIHTKIEYNEDIDDILGLKNQKAKLTKLDENQTTMKPTNTTELDNTTRKDEQEETRDALTEKIVELFHFCDVENKGYVARGDLYRLRDELGLEFSDIDNAFDELDTNGDSFLSMEEFTTGFGLFVGVAQSRATTDFPTGAENDEGIKIDFSFQVS